MQSLLILGRQPALGLAELESLYGGAAIRTAGQSAALLDIEPSSIDFARLGGSVKLCKVLTILASTNWGDIETYLLQSAPKHAGYLPEGKLKLGISAFDLRVTTQRIQATGLSLKKALKQSGRSVRLVPNKEPALNSASVLHNGLTGELGWELVFLRDGQQTIVAQTVEEQDIDSYTVRDRDRPMRDARVGMLPPKLAQIIINLTNPGPGAVVLDPFCGTGVLLQEALLMNRGAYGSDIDQRMIDYSQANIEWLKSHWTGLAKKVDAGELPVYLELQDATAFLSNHTISVIACETYLGRPFTSSPAPDVLNQTISECNLIIKKFLGIIHGQVPRGTRLCLAVPAWQVGRGRFRHLPLLDSLRDLGYNRISFEHARSEDLIYYREDQVVARQLLVLAKL